MNLRSGFSRGLVALAAAALALQSLAYGDFAPGGVTLPGWIPARGIGVPAAALLLLTASAALCLRRTALPAVVTIGIYEALWAAFAMPPILADPLSLGAWYGCCEALTSLTGTMLLAVMLRWPARGLEPPLAARRALRAAQALFGLTCIFYGTSHFAYAGYTASMVPAWLPGPLALAYLTGLGHIAAGIGVTSGLLPRLAATLEAIMMSLFGLLVWVPTFFVQPRPAWATPPQNQWSELVVNLVLAAAAWVVAGSIPRRDR